MFPLVFPIIYTMPRNPKDVLDTSGNIRAALDDSPSENGDNWDSSSTEEDSEYEPNEQDAHMWDKEKK